MGMRFLHGTLVFSLFLLLSLFNIAGSVYAAPWFTTYGGGVISGNADSDSIKSTQPYFAPWAVFKSALIQPGMVTPNPTMPSFAYGGIITSGSITSPTDKDAFAKNIGVLGGSLPDYQRFANKATTVIPANCDHNKLLTSCNLSPGIYKASLADINSSLNNLNTGDKKYHIGGNKDGLLVLVQDPASTGTVAINYKVQPVSSAGYKRLVLITNTKINISSTVGNTNFPTQAQYLSQNADIQAMLITTSTSDPAVEVATGANKLKIEGPIISKGKMRFRRDAGTAWPGVFVQYNPFYITELAKLDASLNIFGSSSVRWVYE